MEEILRELNMVVGVRGSFLCSTDGQILARAMPDAWQEQQLVIAGRVAGQTFQALTSAGQRAKEIDLVFAEGRLLLKNLRSATLFIYCARNVNLPLLNLSASSALKKLGAEIKLAAPPPARRRVAPSTEPVPNSLPESSRAQPVLFALPADWALPDSQARHLIELARGRGLTLRALGTLGNYWHCHTAREWLGSSSSPQVIELAGLAKETVALTDLFRDAGFEINARFSAFYGNQRALYENGSIPLRAQLFLDNYEMYHRFAFASHLSDEELTLPVTFLFLARLQSVEISDYELRELCALCLDHDLSFGPGREKIDGATITDLCADDWGWFKTATLTLDKLVKNANWLGTSDREALGAWVDRLTQSIHAAPKSLRWQMRARLGESTRWYHVPQQPGTTARPDLAIG